MFLEAIATHFKKKYNVKYIECIHNAFDFQNIDKRASEPNNDPFLETDYILFYGRFRWMILKI